MIRKGSRASIALAYGFDYTTAVFYLTLLPVEKDGGFHLHDVRYKAGMTVTVCSRGDCGWRQQRGLSDCLALSLCLNHL